MNEKQIADYIVEPDQPDEVAGQLRERKQIQSTRRTEVFNFKEKWHLVRPFLNHPKAAEALERAMNDYIEMNRDECMENGWEVGLKRWADDYDPDCGPWSYTRTDYWDSRADAMAEESQDRGEAEFKWTDSEDPSEAELERYGEFMAQFYPQPDTVEWYQLFHGAFFLVHWLKELGSLVFPELNWKVAEGQKFAFAYATDGKGNIVLIFDILNFDEMTATELVKFVKAKDRTRPTLGATR